MTGRERVVKVLAGKAVDRAPTLPMVHTGLAGHCGVRLGAFFTDAEVMARVMIEGCRRFGFDGVQLSLGVTGEAEALGANVEQPGDGAPILREHLLADLSRLDALRGRDVAAGGRLTLFADAVDRTVRGIGDDTFVLATLRGPMLIASQLRGVETLLMDMIDVPEQVERMLAFTTDVAAAVGRALLPAGAHGVLLGEATCSPNFISPAMYRQLVLPFHRQLVAGLHEAGWPAVGLHVCGNTVPIVEDLIATGVDFFDVDYQVSAREAIGLSQGRVALRGNLDPSSVFRFGDRDAVARGTAQLAQDVAGERWIMGSGCDIPPGTPTENLQAFADVARGTA
jgi:MtaA/CmuA family methyltransferase